MSSIFGILSRTGKPVTQDSLSSMSSSLTHWQPDRTGAWRSPTGAVALGHLLLFNTPQSLDESLPLYDPAARLAITADARLDNRSDLCAHLGISPEQHKTIPDSLLILKAYCKWGTECAAHLIGDFAFAVWDEDEHRLFCARDHLGVKPFFYFCSDEVFLFATEMKGLFRAGDVPRTLNPGWIADALTVSIADKEYTPYQSVWRLPPAHWLLIDPARMIKTNYWQLDPEKVLHLATEADYVEALREKLLEAVRCRLRSSYPVGSELSGGLDSSTVTGLAARVAEALGTKFIAFSHIVGEDDWGGEDPVEDEHQFQELLCQYAGIRHHYSLSSHGRGAIDVLRRDIDVQDGPTMRVYGVMNDVIFETAAQEGVRSLLSGFGGDEVVSYQAGDLLNELVHRRDWNTLWSEYLRPAKGRKISLSGLLTKMAGEYFPGLKTVYQNRNRKRAKTAEELAVIHLETYPLARNFYTSANIQSRLASNSRMSTGNDVRWTQYLRLMHPSVPARLEYCAIAAAAQHIEFRYPLLDIRLLEFHLAAPSALKRKDGYGRYLFRKAMQGFVPAEIQWRDDKAGAAVPTTRRRIQRDAAAFASLIERSRHNCSVDYINLDQMAQRLERITHPESGTGPVRQGVFMNAIKMLLFFDQIE